jgi:hypothetical protein
MDKNDYYYNFKTRLESQPYARFKSLVGRVNPIDPNKNKNNQSDLVLTNFFFPKKSMIFLSGFYPGLAWVFDWVKSSQSFIFFLNPNQFRSRVNQSSQS